MDFGHTETDKQLKKLENRIEKEYAQAAREVKRKAKTYLDKYKVKDKIKREQLKQGLITKADYQQWKTGQIMIGKRWEEMRDTLYQDLGNANNIAKSMITGFTHEVYALNHNYGTFEVEKGSLLDTSYTLYDRQTVERLIKDRPTLLPKFDESQKEIDKEKRWSMTKMDSAVLQGILQGESMDGIAKRLTNVVGMDERIAIRNARTMTTASENLGRKDSYERAEKMGIKLKNQWVATLDGRTRHSHRMLDGEIEEVGEEFSNGCEYPGDPSGDPSEVYNCRCTLIAVVDGIDYDLADMKGYNGKLGDMSYDEWKYGHGVEQKQPEPQSLRDYIEGIKKEIKERGGVVTEEYLHKAGRRIADDYDAMMKEKIEKSKDEVEKIDKKLEPLIKKEQELRSKQNELYHAWRNNEIGYEELSRVRVDLSEVSVRVSTLNSQKRRLVELSQDESEKWMKEKLSEIRTVGMQDIDIKSHLTGKSPVRKNIEYAYSHYPTDWISASVKKGTLATRKVQRGYYNGFEIALSGFTEDSFNETAFHELGHRFEDSVKGIKEAETAFFKRRTEGGSYEWLGKGYRRDETAIRDNFLDHYMGKSYSDGSYELVSMGFQYAFSNPQRLAKDPDMQSWIYGILALL